MLSFRDVVAPAGRARSNSARACSRSMSSSTWSGRTRRTATLERGIARILTRAAAARYRLHRLAVAREDREQDHEAHDAGGDAEHDAALALELLGIERR